MFVAKAKYVHCSPYKLRPIVDAIRGKGAHVALNWLATHRVKRVVPILKTLESAIANARQLKNLDPAELIIEEIKVDQGPIIRYFKPGAMGRANPQRKRLSHISVSLSGIKN